MLDYTSILKYLPITTATTADYILINSAGNNKKILLSDFISSLGLSGGGGVTSVTGISPIASSGGTTPAISIGDAAADGTTKGAATFNASDFDSSSGVISIDYTNAQKATASTKGFLTDTDWSAFSAKQDAITLTTTGTSGAATLSGNTLNIPNYATGSPTAIDIQKAFTDAGSSIKGIPVYNVSNNITNFASLVSQTMYMLMIHIPVAATITGVRWYQSIGGNFTGNNYNGVGLYSYSGGTFTLVASSTNDATIWQQASGAWRSKAFSSTYSASAGIYWVAFLYSSSAQTTAPGIGLNNTLTANHVAMDFTNSAGSVLSIASRTSLPATQAASGMTKTTTSFGVILY